MGSLLSGPANLIYTDLMYKWNTSSYKRFIKKWLGTDLIIGISLRISTESIIIRFIIVSSIQMYLQFGNHSLRNPVLFQHMEAEQKGFCSNRRSCCMPEKQAPIHVDIPYTPFIVHSTLSVHLTSQLNSPKLNKQQVHLSSCFSRHKMTTHDILTTGHMAPRASQWEHISQFLSS